MVGILVVFGAICGGFAMAGGHFPVLIQPSEFVVILGAALGTLIYVVARPHEEARDSRLQDAR